MRRRSAALVVLLAGCGAGTEGPRLLYSADPLSLDNPFPDPRLLARGGVGARPKHYEPFLPRDALRPSPRAFFEGHAPMLNSLAGFGNFGSFALRFSEPPDPATLDGNVVFAVGSADGSWEPVHAVVESVADPLFGDAQKFMLVRPKRPLPAVRAAILAVRRGVTTASGRPLVRSLDYDRAQKAVNEKEARAAASVDVDGAPFARDARDIVFSLGFDLPDPTADLAAVASWIAGAPPVRPQIPPKATTPTPVGAFDAADADFGVLDPWLLESFFPVPNRDSVGKVVIGRLPTRDLRGSSGLFDPARVADPGGAPELLIDFVLTVPKGPKPAGGWPTVIGGHGLGGRNALLSGKDSFCMSLAELFARKGLSCLGIDAVSHGSRGSIFNFFSVKELRVARDNFRQTTVDTMFLARMAQSVDLDGDSAPDLSPEILYFGNSMGGVMGATFLSLDPRTNVGVLNVPGAGLTTILLSEDIRDRVGILIAADSGLEYQSPAYVASFPYLRVLAGLAMDPADPANYAARLLAKTVLLQEGIGDRTLPNAATAILAEAMGARELLAAETNPAGVSGRFRVDATRYGITDPDFDPHNVFGKIPGLREQATRYLASRGVEFVLP